MTRALRAGLLAIACIVLLGCSVAGGGTAPSAVVAPATVAGPTSAPAAATSATTANAPPTAGQLASMGQVVFAQNCASCHGDQGQGVIGPALIGPSAALSPYGTGRGLYDFVSTNMPQNAPGSLSPDQYLQVVGFILVRNNFTSDQAPLSTDTLSSVQLRR